jgi:hypothetical protein
LKPLFFVARSGILVSTFAACDPEGPASPSGAPVFATEVLEFEPGEFAGYGQDRFPDVVLGGPQGGGASAGGLDVLSLGLEGWIVLGFGEEPIVDGEGPDLIVFENPFPGWVEPGRVEVSEDGIQWTGWSCAGTDTDAGYPGCAGVTPVLANVVSNGVNPVDPDSAGGDAFDLAEIGVVEARFVRITDDGTAPEFGYQGQAGGFDLDAVAVVNAAR